MYASDTPHSCLKKALKMSKVLRCSRVFQMRCTFRGSSKKKQVSRRKNMLRSLLSALIMGACTYGAWYGLKALGLTSNLILCALPICVGVVVYLVCAVTLKAITREDCLLLPKGEKIAKLLHL
jgi:hypothetical protein